MCAVVERDVDAEFGAGIEQPGAIRILTNHARGLVWSDAVLSVGEPGPRLAEVVGAINVWREIAEQIPIDGDISGSGSLWARLDILDAAAGRQVLRCDVGPILSVVARHVHQPVVRSGPEQALLHRRFADCVKRAVYLLAGRVARDRGSARLLRLARRIGCQIGTDLLPGHTA